MLTSVKLGLIATATMAAAVPTSMILLDRDEREERVETTAATMVVEKSPALPEQPATGTTPAPAEPPRPDIASRVSAGFALVGEGAAIERAPAPVAPPAAGDGSADLVEERGVETVGLAPDPAEGDVGVPERKPERPEARRVSRGGEAYRRPVAEYRAMVAREAEAQKVPREIAEAIVEVASGYDPRLRGPDGKVGLTQVSPRIARALGYRGTDAALAEPATNVVWGMKYIAGAWRRADGDLCRTAMKFVGGHYVETQTAIHRGYCEKVKQAMATPTQ